MFHSYNDVYVTCNNNKIELYSKITILGMLVTNHLLMSLSCEYDNEITITRHR